ncbi:biliverdin-producing heme oxygenase [Anditalea andensis]|uniref:Heme oxygenase n=1 Tax=Anditalea andensis TaxID=1048983 RepID=A0A074L5G6_9BACT|nr:biliverdin-producing heme oxygenase [Anditalea andensis]KEO75063.1 hypothetical protein EL17_05160 [Anditalea andensis]
MISATLKEKTKQLHAETESSLNAKRIFSLDFSLPEYINILQALYIAHMSLESSLGLIMATYDKCELKKHYTPLSHHLQKDLEELAISTTRLSLISLKDINPLNGIGILYVLNGSSLGAKHINKRLREIYVQWPVFSGQFYEASSGQTIEEWKAFSTILDSLVLNPEETNQVIEGAEVAFKTFIKASKEIGKII